MLGRGLGGSGDVDGDVGSGNGDDDVGSSDVDDDVGSGDVDGDVKNFSDCFLRNSVQTNNSI